MTTLRMQQEAENEGEERESEADDDEEGEEREGEGKDSEDGTIDMRLQDGTLLPPSAIDPIGRGHGQRCNYSLQTSSTQGCCRW